MSVRRLILLVQRIMGIRLSSVVIATLALLVAIAWPKNVAMAADRAPNIVWLVQDHVPWRQTTATDGPKPVLPTFQRLAASGIVFQQARCVTPLCSPARATMMTGVYPHNHGVTGNDAVVQERNTYYPEYKPFNQYMQSAGYVAGYFGKYHAGPIDPLQLGFEGYSPKGYGDPYTTPRYTQYLREKGLPNPVVEPEWRLTSGSVFGPTGQKVAPTSNGGMAGKLLTPPETHESYFVASLASDWIDQRAKAGDNRPFVLRVDTWGPHQPYLVSKPFQNLINPQDIPEYPNFANTFADRPLYQQKRRDLRRSQTGMTSWSQWQPLMARIYENFSQTDSALLQVLDALERNGLTENTIIIYTADHGDIAGSGGGLFDKDAFMTEEVMSIPMVIKWPGITTGGQKSDAFVSNLDIVPTVLEMAGVKVPDDMDGKSLVPLVKKPNDTMWRDSWMAEHHGHNEMRVFQRALYYKNYKFVAHLNDKDEFYDLAADPFEMQNRIDDVAMQPIIAEMKSRLVAQMAESNDDAPDAQKLIEQLGLDYGTVTLGNQELRIGLTKDVYPIELPYGFTLAPEVRVEALNSTFLGKRLSFRVKPATSLPGELVVETYDDTGALVHTARVQFNVAQKPQFEAHWGDAAVLTKSQGATYVKGEGPFSINSTTPAELFASVSLLITPDVEDSSVSADGPATTIYTGNALPKHIRVDSGLFTDGPYALRASFTMRNGTVFTEDYLPFIANWNTVVDDLEPPQNSGWFGVIKRRATVQESEGWVTVTDPAGSSLDDNTRIAPQALGQFLIWEADGLRRFTITAYTKDVATVAKMLSVAVSPSLDGWQPVTYTVEDAGLAEQGWHKVLLSGEVGEAKPVKYLRIQTESAPLVPGDMQLGRVEIASPRT